MNVAQLLVGQASQRPEAPAIIERSGRKTRRLSFLELDERTARAAAFLTEAGINPGDHVLVFVPMSIDLYVAMIAIFRIGGVATFLDPSTGAAHIERCCEMIHPAAMIAIGKAHLLRIRSASLRNIRNTFSIGWPVPGARRFERSLQRTPESSILPRDADDPALVTFTSGSTGLPKAAVRSHGFLFAQHASLQQAIKLVAGEIDLATLPIFSLANLASGVTTVIPDADLRRVRFVEPDPIFLQIAEHKISRCVASPAFFERLLSSPNAAQSMRHLKHVYTGGAPVFPGLMDRLQQAMPQAEIVAVYGSTEAEPIAHIARDEILREDFAGMFSGAGLLAGPAVQDIQLRIIANQWGHPIGPMTRSQFELAALPPTNPGEIVVHGDHVLRGYMNGVGNEQSKFSVDGQIWHRTGDAGYLDERGRLWLLGRAEAKIDDVKGTLYPFSVECAAGRIEGIVRTAMILHKQQRWLAIEAKTSDRAALENALRRELSWAHIEQIRFLSRIPLDKRHNAKIDYPELRRTLGS